MTKEVVTVFPDTPLVDAARVLTQKGFTGLPVVDSEHKVVGLVTEYDLIVRGSSIHLPTLAKLLTDIDFYKTDKEFAQEDLKKLLEMKVKDVMNSDPMTLAPYAAMDEATRIFAEHHAVNPIPIVDDQKKLVGVLARFDLIRLFAPSAKGIEEEHRVASPARVQKFLKDFEKEFVVVSRARTRWWMVASIFFVVVGFIIAFALILRLSA